MANALRIVIWLIGVWGERRGHQAAPSGHVFMSYFPRKEHRNSCLWSQCQPPADQQSVLHGEQVWTCPKGSGWGPFTVRSLFNQIWTCLGLGPPLNRQTQILESIVLPSWNFVGGRLLVGNNFLWRKTTPLLLLLQKFTHLWWQSKDLLWNMQAAIDAYSRPG